MTKLRSVPCIKAGTAGLSCILSGVGLASYHGGIVVMRVTGGNKKVIHPTPGWIQTQDLSGCCLRTISQTRFYSSNLPSQLNSKNYFSASLNWGDY
jgi:hypothetical protein